ncbi:MULTISPECIES: GntR family transcriptional regulator [Paracoccus]|uniref:GntR family transcriptional regulator n=1 Tax=Paracoccus TaxID=265 RepID=UPI000780511E|nr:MULTISPECIES: GntR family transcriptional regulator [Paracoccus]MCV2446144.1 GntR family transcriptional regulator [Paracoccus sp. DMF]MDQ7777199.1 GntR family transcriptional regulator [Paracoccus aminovorans]
MTRSPDPTLADRVFAALSRQIEAGELAPGQRLRQDEIAAAFGASHVPVREAFRRLEAEGLVESLPRRGVRVAMADRAALAEAIEMRAALEALALRHAAEAYPPGHLAALAAADHACARAVTAAEWEAANQSFHSLLLQGCPMPRLMQTIERLQLSASRMARQLGAAHPLGLPRENRDHRAMLSALQGRDIDLAAQILSRHIRRGLRLNYR